MEYDLAIKSPQSGSPLISLDLIVFYFVAFLIILAITYGSFHLLRKPKQPNHFKNLLILSVILKIVIAVSAIVLAAVYFLPTPSVSKSFPEPNSNQVSAASKIEIQFDRPVSRSNLVKKITPEVPGVWQFEVGLYKTHFYRKLVFYPDVTLLPDTEYVVELENIKNVSKIAKAENYTFRFKTTTLPKISKINPENDSHNVDFNSEIKVTLDKPNEGLADFNFIVNPDIKFDVVLSPDKTFYTLTPKQKLKQATTYNLIISKNPTQYRTDGSIAFRGEETKEYTASFTTKLPPEISSFSPTGDQVLINSKFEIEFSKPVARFSAAKNFSTTNGLEGKLVWQSDKKLSFIPTNLKNDTNYALSFAKGIVSHDGSVSQNDTVLEFKTIGPVRLVYSSSFSHSDGDAVGVNNSLRFNFDQPVNQLSAQSHFSISPSINGNFSWDGNTMIFKPDAKLQYDTNYSAMFSPGIESENGLSSKDTFSLNFSTESFIFKLAVPEFLQKYALSCETASLNMILAFRGFRLTEDELLSSIGFDSTPRGKGIWGNPHEAFVGDVKGKQMNSGYGVYWEPIERVAKNYRKAESFSNWSISNLTEQILKGNPVQVWVYSRGGVPTTWNTADGKEIYAVSGEHSIVVKGFVGKPENPLQIIVNDPLIGELYLAQSVFNQKWDSFSRSGVVVF